MKNQIYNEMCAFLAGQEELLKEFKDFHEKNKESDNYLNLFENKYGAIYKNFKAKSTIPPGPESDFIHNSSAAEEDYYSKYVNPTKQSFIAYINDPTPDSKVEKILKIVALIVLIAGIIGSLCLMRTIVFMNSSLLFSYLTDHTFNFTGFLLSFSPALSGIIGWAVLNVLRNISINLFEIRKQGNK